MGPRLGSPSRRSVAELPLLPITHDGDLLGPEPGRGGITIGNVYFTSNNPLYVTPERIKHEKVHVQQWEKYGLDFGYLYIMEPKNACTNGWEIQANLYLGGYTKNPSGVC